MKKINLILLLLTLFSFAPNLKAQEVRGPDWRGPHTRSRVGNVGQCWTGRQVTTVEFINGDRAYLHLDSEADRVKFALATSALLSDKDVWYRLQGCGRVCEVQRCRIEFLTVSREGVGGIW